MGFQTALRTLTPERTQIKCNVEVTQTQIEHKLVPMHTRTLTAEYVNNTSKIRDHAKCSHRIEEVVAQSIHSDQIIFSARLSYSEATIK